MKTYVLAVLGAGICMNISEFLRNELLFKDKWVTGFQNLGLTFPSDPINGAIWGLWSFIMCSIIVALLTHMSILKTTVITWTLGFVLMWVAMLNLGLFPDGLLTVAVPWSFLEVYLSAWIANTILHKLRN